MPDSPKSSNIAGCFLSQALQPPEDKGTEKKNEVAVEMRKVGEKKKDGNWREGPQTEGWRMQAVAEEDRKREKLEVKVGKGLVSE